MVDTENTNVGYLIGRLMAYADYVEAKKRKVRKSLSNRYYDLIIQSPYIMLPKFAAEVNKYVDYGDEDDETITHILVRIFENIPQKLTDNDKCNLCLGRANQAYQLSSSENI